MTDTTRPMGSQNSTSFFCFFFLFYAEMLWEIPQPISFKLVVEGTAGALIIYSSCNLASYSSVTEYFSSEHHRIEIALISDYLFHSYIVLYIYIYITCWLSKVQITRH